MLVSYANGAKKYLLKPEAISVGDTVVASESADAKVGNAMPLKNVPDGFMVHNIEVRPGQVELLHVVELQLKSW
jgi:large subunit ribosomal protein L2